MVFYFYLKIQFLTFEKKHILNDIQNYKYSFAIIKPCFTYNYILDSTFNQIIHHHITFWKALFRFQYFKVCIFLTINLIKMSYLKFSYILIYIASNITSYNVF